MAKPNRRELVQLADKYKPDHKNTAVAGWLYSEKLDGSRAFWDGGITRGIPTVEVPWAGLTHPKKLTPKPKIKPVSTGLWSRYGNPIIAPDWFLDSLPHVMLDGELFAGRGNFQLSRSIVSGDEPDDRWDQIKYAVYGAPSWQTMLAPGLVKNNSMYCEIPSISKEWYDEFISKLDTSLPPTAAFEDEIEFLLKRLDGCDNAYLHSQYYLPRHEGRAREMIEDELLDVIRAGGEGLIIRDPSDSYNVKRSKSVLKHKPYNDDEGVLVGFTAGRGKYKGKIGALILDYNGKRLELSGMTDADREITAPPTAEGSDYPVSTKKTGTFQVGDIIEFRYRELSDSGVPKESRYLRVKR